MTRAEFARELQVKESYLTKRWNVVVASRARQGIEICKCGIGDEATYGIRYPWEKELRFEYKDGVSQIGDILDNLGVEYEEAYEADDLVFDFYISDADVIIDWCGRGELKKQWCELNGIQYVNIAATEEINEEMIEEKIYG